MDKQHCRITVQWETSSKKNSVQTAAKVLLFYTDRFHVLGQPGGSGAKAQLQLERCVHYLDLRGVHVPDTDACRIELTLSNGDCLQFVCSTQDDCARIITHSIACLRLHLPQIGQRLIEMCIPARWQLDLMIAQHLSSTELLQAAANSDKCGNFSSAYDLFASYLGVAAKPEIKWDVDTIYFSQGASTFRLLDFSHFDYGDFASSIGALAFNNHFSSLDCSGVKLPDSHGKVLKSLDFLLSYNCTLKELNFSGCNLKCEFLRVFAASAEKNTELRLISLDLSNNNFSGGDDKTVPEQLSQILTRLSPNLEKLSLARCGLSMKRLNRCLELLVGQTAGPLPLRQLCIDGCGVGGAGGGGGGGSGAGKNEMGAGLLCYLTKLSSLEQLSCADCGLVLESLVPVLLKLTSCLSHLDLSGNQYSSPTQGSHPTQLVGMFIRRPSISNVNAKGDDAAATLIGDSRDFWAEFFAACRALRRVHLNRCRLPPSAAQGLLVGLSNGGGGGGGLSLELAGNDFGPGGAQILRSCLQNYRISRLESLDLSDNDFGVELNRLVETICRCDIRHLAIGGNNYRGPNRKDPKVIQEFSDLVTDDKCSLTSLSIRGAKLGSSLAILLNTIGQCKNLCRLDITDNLAGDLGARILAKSLYINASLTEVRLDGNKISAAGLRDLADALRFNRTLLRLPLPVSDLATVSSSSQQMLQDAMELLQEGLLRNNRGVGRMVNSRDYWLHAELSNYSLSADNYRAQAEVVIATATAAASAAAVPEIAESIRRCRLAAEDAESAKRLLIRLQGEGNGGSGSDELGDSSATRRFLTVDMPAPSHAALSADLAAAQSEMLRRAADACPGAFADDQSLIDNLWARLGSESARCQAGVGDVADSLSRSAVPALAAQLSVLKLNSALAISGYLQEVVIHNLQQSLDSLNSLLRTKILGPTLRRNLAAPVSPRTEGPLAGAGFDLQPPPSRGSRGRPLSIFPASLTARHRHAVDDGLPDDTSELPDDTDAADVKPPQALPRRPMGDRNRRLPTRQQPPPPQKPLPQTPLPQPPQTQPPPPQKPLPQPPLPQPQSPPSTVTTGTLPSKFRIPAGAVAVPGMAGMFAAMPATPETSRAPSSSPENLNASLPPSKTLTMPPKPSVKPMAAIKAINCSDGSTLGTNESPVPQPRKRVNHRMEAANSECDA